jgi:ankyrin repeat protein
MPTDNETTGRFIDAIVNRPDEALKMLREQPELRDARWLHEETVMHFLAVEYYTDAVRFCLENGFDPNATSSLGTTALLDVCLIQNNEMAKLLLEHGADPNCSSLTMDCPLHQAIQRGDLELLELLLKAGADTTYKTDMGSTIFDDWPPNFETRSRLIEVLKKYDVASLVV